MEISIVIVRASVYYFFTNMIDRIFIKFFFEDIFSQIVGGAGFWGIIILKKNDLNQSVINILNKFFLMVHLRIESINVDK